MTLDDETLSKYVGDYHLEGGDVRRVIHAGNLLFTRRENGPVLPIRPTSQTAFFYEGSATHLVFETDESGEVTGMLMYHDGSPKAEPATRSW